MGSYCKLPLTQLENEKDKRRAKKNEELLPEGPPNLQGKINRESSLCEVVGAKTTDSGELQSPETS